MIAQERLHAARVGTHEGKYTEALSEYIWFHHNALAEDPALYGVRLSFALSYWMELAEVYPPALVALHEIRDNKSMHLRNGELDRALFHDVVSINHYLAASSDSAILFELFDSKYPEFAQACASLALEALLEVGKFHLAAKYIPDPKDRIVKLSERLNQAIACIPERPRSKSPRYNANICNFARDLSNITAILSGANRKAEAEECHSTAFSILKPWYVRNAVERTLID